MIKGGNAFVPSVPLRVAVRGGVDAAGLLLAADGRVRGDLDVVFQGAPVHPSGAVRLAAAEDGTAWLDVNLTSLEEAVDRVLVVAVTEDGAMRDIAGLSVEALAPDGTSVVRYDVTDAGGETAMVLAELYRRAGGWKFRAVGQGYLEGLAALASDHGVEVAAEDVPAAEPGHEPTATVIVPQAPPAAHPAAPTMAVLQEPGPAPAPAAPAPPAAAQPWRWSFGPDFEPYARTGRDNDVITVDGLPRGPVVVELAISGDGYTGLWVIDRLNKDKTNLVNSTEDNFQGRLLTEVPGNGRLRLRLQAEGPWQVRVLPLAQARTLTGEWQEGRGPEVLLHTGGTADLSIHYRGDDNLIVHLYELAGHEDPTALPKKRNVVNEIGRRRETVPLPPGPLVVQMEMADGPWRARLKGMESSDGPQEPAQVSWSGGAPRGQKEDSGVRKMQNWLRRSRW
ncbi:resistance protein [Streptomyces sp. Ru71]|uniref:TerD family protein n=1 Tax=Streptomyces sp. Ru71 TaxID=2080746 RepID=UPI000CDDB612|nr:TerD family protein [Streptomyces sp. Ru71]POX46335.1 resistance protein [Streptomyces sp. Ru71]